MLEALLNPTPRQPNYITVSAPVAKITNAAFARSFSTIGKNGVYLTLTGGVGQLPNAYPTNFPLITLAADGLSVQSTTTANGYDGASPGSTQIGNTLWVAVGNDGVQQRYFRSRNIQTGALLTTSSTSLGLAQEFAKVSVIDSNRLYWGNGFAGSSWTPTAYTYSISSNTWTPIASPGSGFSFSGFRAQAQTLSNGKILVGRNAGEGVFYLYDPVSNTYGRTANWLEFIQVPIEDAGTRYIDAATCVVGKYLFLFDQGYRTSTKGQLGCLRYDCEKDWFDFIDFPGIPPRWGARCVVDSAKGYVYLVGGSTQPTTVISIESSTKFQEALVFSVASLTA